MFGYARFQRIQSRRIATEQVEHVLGGAHRTLDAAQGVTGDEVGEPVVGHEHFVRRVGEALAQGGGLGGDVVGPSSHWHVGVFRREPG